MSRNWKLSEISVWVLCLLIAFAMAANSSAQSDRSDRDSDNQQSATQSQRDSDESSGENRSSREESRSRDNQQSTSADRDRSERRDSDRSASDNRSDRDQREGRDRSSSRDEFRRAPEMYSRQSSSEDRSDEQGGLGVAVEDDERGVRVVRVYSNTPAEEMGLRSGDRITQIDGRRVDSAREFISRIRSMEPGEEVELDIMRNRDERSLTGELESRAEALPQRDQQSYENRQFQYDDGRFRGYTSSQSDRGDTSALNRLYALERQVDQIRRELQQLRSSLEGRSGGESGQRFGRESTVIYYENQPRSDEGRFSTRQSQYEGPWPQLNSQPGSQSRRVNQDRSPGGETGEDRLHPGESQER